MSATTLKLPYKRFVAQVSTGVPRSKSTYLALMAENLEALKACPWREAVDGLASLTGHDFTAKTQFSDAYDAFKLTGNYDSSAMTEIAYAGMAAYRFTVPESAISGGVSITGVSLPISRDRFEAAGVHVAVALSNSAYPSDDWSVVRGSGALAASSLLTQTAAYLTAGAPASGTAGIDLSDVSSGNPPTYLWVYVTLEDYTSHWEKYNAKEQRLYAIEGSAMLVGDSAEVTFASDVAADECLVEIPITRDAVLPSNLSACSAMYGVAVLANGDSFDDLGRADNNGERIYVLTSAQRELYIFSAFLQNPQRYVAGLRQLYAKFNAGQLEAARFTTSVDDKRRVGASFVCRADKWKIKAGAAAITVAGWSISASVIVVPFSVPSDATVRRLRAAWGDAEGGNGTGAVNNGGRYTFWLKRGTPSEVMSNELLSDALLKKPEIYIGAEKSIDGWENLGSSSGDVFEVWLASPLTGGCAALLVTAYVDQATVIDKLFGEGVPKGLSIGFRVEPSAVDADATSEFGAVDASATSNMTPNVSLLGTVSGLGDYVGDSQFLRFTAQQAGSTISMAANGANAPHVSLLKSVNGGLTWTQFSVGDAPVTLFGVGDDVLIKAGPGGNAAFADSSSHYNYFVMTGRISASGPVAALLNQIPNQVSLEEYSLCRLFYNCTSLTTAPTMPAVRQKRFCCYGMFEGCTSLTAAPALPATEMANSCYSNMFHGCTSLTVAPALPATELSDYCYRSMFQGCTSLTAAPALPATEMANSCYYQMFEGCTSLTAAPALPATVLADYCYYQMFKGCTSLTAAPALPATEMRSYCYQYMFKDCSSLAAVTTEQPNFDVPAINFTCTYEWLSGVAASGTFTCTTQLGTQESIERGASACPTGWTVVNV